MVVSCLTISLETQKRSLFIPRFILSPKVCFHFLVLFSHTTKNATEKTSVFRNAQKCFSSNYSLKMTLRCKPGATQDVV